MKRILLLSDTHGHLDERILHYCNEVDEIWHAGDVGNFAVIETLEKIKHCGVCTAILMVIKCGEFFRK